MSDTWQEKLIKVMADRNINQYKLVRATGIRQSRMSDWLRGIGEPGLDQWGLICRALDVPLSTFLPDHLADEVPDRRTPDELMLVNVARKLSLRATWELILELALQKRGIDPLAGPAPTPKPPPGPIKPLREITRRAEDVTPPVTPPAGDPGESGKRPPKRKK